MSNILVSIFVFIVLLLSLFIFINKFGVDPIKPDHNSRTTTISPNVENPTYTNSERNIILNSPKPNQALALPFVIAGQARVFENQLQFRISECDGEKILENSLYASAPDVGQFGPFGAKIETLPIMDFGNVCISTLSYSAKDGSEINTITVPVKIDTKNTSRIKVFFNTDKTAEDCITVFPVERITFNKTTPARTAIEELLKGPTVYEKKMGFSTSINQNVKIQKLNIVNNVANIDFDKTLEKSVAGSCNATNIRSQIEKTLLQFPTIKEVKISINGRVEDILQP